MASACLPALFRAVEIDGVPYWDGGYSGNPAILPFLRATATEDVLIVQINPRERRRAPIATREIMSRVNEITFNASLLAGAARASTSSAASSTRDGCRAARGDGEFRRLRLHRIAMDEAERRIRRPQQAQHRLRVTSRRCASSASARTPALPRRRISDDIGRAARSDAQPEVEAEVA